MGLLSRALAWLTGARSASTVAAVVVSAALTMAIAVPMGVQAVRSGDAVGITDGAPIRTDDARLPDPASVVAAIAGDEGAMPTLPGSTHTGPDPVPGERRGHTDVARGGSESAG